MKRKRLLEAVNDRVKKIAELACSLPSADDHVEAAEAILMSEKKLGLECPTAADAMRTVIQHFGNVNRSSVNDALRMVHSYCSASTTIDVQRPTLCDPVHFQVFADPQTGPAVVGTILSFLTVDVTPLRRFSRHPCWLAFEEH